MSNCFEDSPTLLACAERDSGIKACLGVCTLQPKNSADCQKALQNKRKHACNGDQASSQASARPAGQFVKGILFDTHADKPEFVWIRYGIEDSGNVRVYLGRTLAVNDVECASEVYETPLWSDLDRDTLRGVDLGYTIRLIARDGFFDAGEEPAGVRDEHLSFNYYGEEFKDKAMVNKAVRALHHMRGFAHDWQGPVIAFGFDHITADGHLKGARDLGHDDSRHLENFFNSLEIPVSTISCVRVNSDGDVQAGGRPRFEPIELPVYHAIFQQSATSISSLIELPMAVARIPGNIDVWNKHPLAYASSIRSPKVNQAITRLLIWCNADQPTNDDVDSEEKVFGKVLPLWNDPTGSCVVARLDKHPFHPDHMAALAHFCEYELTSLFRMHMKGDGLSKSCILSHITKPKFAAYYKKWRMNQKSKGHRAPVSPYHD